MAQPLLCFLSSWFKSPANNDIFKASLFVRVFLFICTCTHYLYRSYRVILCVMFSYLMYHMPMPIFRVKKHAINRYGMVY